MGAVEFTLTAKTPPRRLVQDVGPEEAPSPGVSLRHVLHRSGFEGFRFHGEPRVIMHGIADPDVIGGKPTRFQHKRITVP